MYSSKDYIPNYAPYVGLGFLYTKLDFQSFLTNLSNCRGVVLCGPSFSGKSTILKAATFYEEKAKGYNLKSIRIHPKTCTPLQLYGWFSSDGYLTWHDGILTKPLRYRSDDEKFKQWIILDGLLDYQWAENMERLEFNNSTSFAPFFTTSKIRGS